MKYFLVFGGEILYIFEQACFRNDKTNSEMRNV